jgi:hypothetical protein
MNDKLLLKQWALDHPQEAADRRFRRMTKLHPAKESLGSTAYIEHKYTLAPAGLKRCNKCNVVRCISDFWKSGDRAGSGYQGRCKTCSASLQKQRRKLKTYTNAVKARQNSRKWRMAHPELAKKRIKAWNSQHPEHRTEASRRRRARKSSDACYTDKMESVICVTRLWRQ